jgi:hypothetical protein
MGAPELARALHRAGWAKQTEIMKRPPADQVEIDADWENREAIRTFWITIAKEAIACLQTK